MSMDIKLSTERGNQLIDRTAELAMLQCGVLAKGTLSDRKINLKYRYLGMCIKTSSIP
jgi:hypothetical protein